MVERMRLRTPETPPPMRESRHLQTGYRGRSLAMLAVGIAAGLGLAFALQAFAFPPKAPSSSGPTPMMIHPSVNFTGPLPAVEWFVRDCPPGWGLPDQQWECSIQITPDHAYGPTSTATVVGINSTLPQTQVQGVEPTLPLNCTAGTWTEVTIWVILPPSGPTSVDLPIDIHTT